MDETAQNYSPDANSDDGSCIEDIFGCTDATAFNYNIYANTDDGSCEEVVEGCTNETAFNYNTNANTDDGSCEAVVEGCIDEVYDNYNPLANTDDGSCSNVVVEEISEFNLSVYPNPAENFLRITLDNSSDKIIQVQVLSYVGSVIIDKAIYKNSDGKFDLNIKHLDQGVYILKTFVNGKYIYCLDEKIGNFILKIEKMPKRKHWHFFV
jgi:hypothetical protein